MRHTTDLVQFLDVELQSDLDDGGGCAVKRKTNFFFRRLLRNKSGAVAIIAAVAIPAFVGLAALGVDAGYLYHAQRTLEASAAAAALAGAEQIGNANGTPIATATSYSSVSGDQSRRSRDYCHERQSDCDAEMLYQHWHPAQHQSDTIYHGELSKWCQRHSSNRKGERPNLLCKDFWNFIGKHLGDRECKREWRQTDTAQRRDHHRYD